MKLGVIGLDLQSDLGRLDKRKKSRETSEKALTG